MTSLAHAQLLQISANIRVTFVCDTMPSTAERSFLNTKRIQKGQSHEEGSRVRTRIRNTRFDSMQRVNGNA